MGMKGPRVVITGIGMVSPLGIGTEKNWDALLEGRTQYGQAPEVDHLLDKKSLRRLGRAARLSTVAADEAILAAGAVPGAVVIGSAVGGYECVEEASRAGKADINYILRILPNTAAGHIAIKHDIRGPNLTLATACATGAHSVGEAYRLIQYGDADSAIAGASEAMATPLHMAGFEAMGVISKSGSVRPFQSDRDGMMVSEGSAMLVLESLNRAKQRGAKVYAEIVGYGMSADAMSLMTPSGQGAYDAMDHALIDAGIDVRCIDYLNAHGTGTVVGDSAEKEAIERLFGERGRLTYSSTKQFVGHLLGAAGSYEVAVCALALRDGQEPMGMYPMEYAMSNSFGFGGTNASLILRRY